MISIRKEMKRLGIAWFQLFIFFNLSWIFQGFSKLFFYRIFFLKPLQLINA
jgi:hypothetical protein